MAERLISLSDRLNDNATSLDKEDRKLFRVGMSNYVQVVLQEAHYFYLLNNEHDLQTSLNRIIEISEVINL